MDAGLKHAAALFDKGERREAIRALEACTRSQPENLEAMCLLGQALLDEGRSVEAEPVLRRACASGRVPGSVFLAWAEALRLQGRTQMAAEAGAEGLRREPCHPMAIEMLRELLRTCARTPKVVEALEEVALYFARATERSDGTSKGILSQGIVLELAGKRDEAAILYRRALDRFPDSQELHNNLGLVLRDQGHIEAGLKHLERAAQLAPENVGTACNLGETYRMMRRYTEATEVLRRTKEAHPEHYPTRMSYANLLYENKSFEALLRELDELTTAFPQHGGPYNVLGNTHSGMGNPREALEAYLQCLKRQPNNAVYQSNLLLALNYDPARGREEIFQAHRCYEKVLAIEPNPIEAFPAATDPRKRLRIGYLSADLKFHSVAFFFEPILRGHDPREVEVFCYALSASTDAMTDLLKGLSHHWRSLANLSLDEAEARIRADGIDILVDLSGHTGGNRLTLLARRCAPIQVTWLGYPNTTGLSTVDYRFVDAVTDPSGEEAYHTERLVRLSEGFHSFRFPGEINRPAPPPCERNGYISFGCFNNSAKISPALLRLWGKILARMPEARLVLKNPYYTIPFVRERVVRCLEEGGARAEQLLTLPYTRTLGEHLDCYAHIDIALDTFPYNGTTTTVEALRMGVPVLTVRGDRHCARVGESLLGQVGLEDWVARDADDYVERAVQMSTRRDYLRQLRTGLEQMLADSPLTDYVGLARKIENAYRRMWLERCVAAGVDGPEVEEVRRRVDKFDRRSAARATARKGLRALRAKDAAKATEHLREATATDPDNGMAWRLLGDAYQDLGAWKEAEDAYGKAAALLPREALLLANWGSALAAQERHAEAVERFRAALEVQPDRPGVYLNLGASLHRLDRLAEAEAAYTRALQLLPTFPEAHNNLARVHHDAGDNVRALEGYLAAVRLRPAYADAHANFLRTLLHVTDDVRVLRDQHRAWAEVHEVVTPSRAQERTTRGGLTIGFVSGDLRTHAVAAFLTPVLEALTRQGVPCHLFANQAMDDAVSRHLREVAASWTSIWGLSDAEAARVIAARTPEVLIDLSGHTTGGRLGVFALRPARWQLSWLGYPHHPGGAAIEAVIGDTTLYPHADDRVLRLPRGCHVFCPPWATPAVTERQGTSVRLAAFHPLSKLGDRVLALYADVLRALPTAQLLFRARGLRDAGAREAFLGRVKAAGIARERVEILPYAHVVGEHLEAYRDADVALDCFPYNGMTTTAEALWMGVPVVTLPGDGPQSRVAASMLRQMGHPEWVAADAEGFVDTVRRLATHSTALADLRKQLRSRVQASPLGDPDSVASDLRAALEERWGREATPAEVPERMAAPALP